MFLRLRSYIPCMPMPLVYFVTNPSITLMHCICLRLSTDPQECANGFALQERVQTVRNVFNGGRPTLNSVQSVSPQINFTCDGNITKWIVGANWNSNRNLYPELQVWRRVNDSIPDRYHRVGNTTIAVASENTDSRVYEYPVDPPLPVEAGDVLGIFQPVGSDSRLRMLYERDTGPSTLYQTTSISQEDYPEPDGEMLLSHFSLPLITVQIGKIAVISTGH